MIYFLLSAAMIFFTMRFACGAYVMGYGHRHGGSRAGDGARHRTIDGAEILAAE